MCLTSDPRALLERNVTLNQDGETRFVVRGGPFWNPIVLPWGWAFLRLYTKGAGKLEPPALCTLSRKSADKAPVHFRQTCQPAQCGMNATAILLMPKSRVLRVTQLIGTYLELCKAYSFAPPGPAPSRVVPASVHCPCSTSIS